MRKTSPIAFVFGRLEYRADLSNGARLLNLFREYGIIYKDFCEDGDGGVRFSVSPFSASAAELLCGKKGIAIEKKDAFGLPHLLYLYRRRWGLAVGAVLAALTVWVSGLFLWDIRVTGNENVTYSEIVKILAECGFYVGRDLKGIDVDSIETRVLLGSDKISWISINMKGTCADVQIREAETPPAEVESRPANVVAVRDGQVEHLEILSGYAQVTEGSTVRKGDLLISGIRDVGTGGYTVTRADGKVYAVTERKFELEVPLEYQRKTSLESKTLEKHLIFFSKEIKIFKRDTPNGEFCDTIDNVEVLRFFGGVRIPIGVRTVSGIITETVTERYSDERAREIAYYRLGREMEKELSDAQILKKTVTWELTEEAYVLRCTVRCIENIGKTVEFDAG